ncbi:MAG: CotH kinase family protein [Pseudomonadota bacterium]
MRNPLLLLALVLLATACSDENTKSAAGPVPPDPCHEPLATSYPAAALPTMHIDTEDAQPVESKDEYLEADFSVSDAAGNVLHEGEAEIRGRGNWTWTLEKKPYRIKLESSTALLGMPANRHWVLLANHADRSLLRNAVTFELSRQLGMAWTPRAQSVHVELNGEYLGVYELTEHVRIGSHRVNIPELKVGNTSPDTVSGGYLIEVDDLRGEDFCIDSEHDNNMVFCLVSPETLLDPAWTVQRAWIEDYIRNTENAIYGEQFADPVNGYAAWLDVDSAVDYYLVQEITKNIDGILQRSTFLHKPRDGRLVFGPVWDFDLALGNMGMLDFNDPEGWRSRYASWYQRLFEDPVFAQKVHDRWIWLRDTGKLDALRTYIDEHAGMLANAQAMNFERWPVLDTDIGYSTGPGSYACGIREMKSWLDTRIAWMDEAIAP